MLPTAHRLTDSDTFRRTVRSGRRAGSSRLVVHLDVDEQAPHEVMVGFTVSKSVGNSVVRNRVKRRLRHLTREHLHSLEELPGRVVLVVRAQPAAALSGDGREALGDDLAHCLRKVMA